MESLLSFFRIHWDHEPLAVRRWRRTKSADKSDALQTLRARGRVNEPRASVWSACVFSAAFSKQTLRLAFPPSRRARAPLRRDGGGHSRGPVVVPRCAHHRRQGKEFLVSTIRPHANSFDSRLPENALPAMLRTKF